MAFEFLFVRLGSRKVYKHTIQKYFYRNIVCSSCKHNQVFLRQRHKKKDSEEVKPISIDVNEENQYEKLAEIVTPLLGVDYSKQLEMKWLWSRYVLNQFASDKKKKMCFIENTIPSPLLEGYRNKSEFGIRKGVDGNPKTVGIFIGSPALGETISVPPTYLTNTPQIHKDVCKLFQEFIMSSPLPANHDLHDGGFWKGIVVRTNSKEEVMLVVLVHPGSKTEEELQENAGHLAEFFESKRELVSLTSLYYQASKHRRCTNDNAPYQLLTGEPYLLETICGYQFRISPESFFQVNVPTAEKLYETLFHLADLKPFSVLLDLCCGTGTVSVLGSGMARSCVGIEMMSQAVEDAKVNAKLNNVENCEFLNGRIEVVMRSVLRRLDNSSDIVAVLNPGRSGLHPNFIKEIRNCTQIRRLIFISCKADAPSMLKNFKNLTNSKFCNSTPFTVTRMVPIDLFPNTNHCELVFLFER